MGLFSLVFRVCLGGNLESLTDQQGPGADARSPLQMEAGAGARLHLHVHPWGGVLLLGRSCTTSPAVTGPRNPQVRDCPGLPAAQEVTGSPGDPLHKGPPLSYTWGATSPADSGTLVSPQQPAASGTLAEPCRTSSPPRWPPREREPKAPPWRRPPCHGRASFLPALRQLLEVQPVPSGPRTRPPADRLWRPRGHASPSGL